MSDTTPTLILVHGHRPTFPARLVEEGAAAMRTAVAAVAGERLRIVDLGPLADAEQARQAAIAAQAHRRGPQGPGCIGIIVSMFNFSSETAIRDFVRLAELEVPILIHTEADSDAPGRMGSAARRDGACGRLSVCNALRHIGARYTTTRKHVVQVDSAEFAEDLAAFIGACAIADRFRRRGRGLRLGLIGSPPDDFQTMTTVSTELLGHIGLQTTTLDLLALDRRMRACPADQVQAQRHRIAEYLPSRNMPEQAADALARLGVVFDTFIAENDLDGLAVRCWSELQEYRIGGVCGISPCTCMSMLSDRLLPAACEVDIAGWMSMMLLQTASGLVPALADWNNMRAEAPDEIDLFHCGVWAKRLLREGGRITSHAILGPVDGIGADNAWGSASRAAAMSSATERSPSSFRLLVDRAQTAGSTGMSGLRRRAPLLSRRRCSSPRSMAWLARPSRQSAAAIPQASPRRWMSRICRMG